MFIDVRKALSSLAALLPSTVVAIASPLWAADGKIYRQQPTVAPAQVIQAPAAPAEVKPAPDPFRRGPVPSWIWGEDIKRRYFLRKEFKAD